MCVFVCFVGGKNEKEVCKILCIMYKQVYV